MATFAFSSPCAACPLLLPYYYAMPTKKKQPEKKYKYPSKRPKGVTKKIFINASPEEHQLYKEIAGMYRCSLSALAADSIIYRVQREAPQILKKYPGLYYLISR